MANSVTGLIYRFIGFVHDDEGELFYLASISGASKDPVSLALAHGGVGPVNDRICIVAATHLAGVLSLQGRNWVFRCWICHADDRIRHSAKLCSAEHYIEVRISTDGK